MNRRAILWCGQFKRPVPAHDAWGIRLEVKKLQREENARLLPADDFRIQVNGLELAFQAARALGVPRDEIHACLVDVDLAPRELATEPYEATITGLQRLVDRLRGRSTPDDALLFVAVNHGAMPPSGDVHEVHLATAAPVDPFADDDQLLARLTPCVLDDVLRPLAGSQVLVVATRFAGAFLPLGHEHRAVVTACAATEPHLVSRADGTCSAFLDELFAAWCGVRHSDAVPAAHLPLAEAFARARERLALPPSLNVPHYAGGTDVWPR